jgi:AraC-binding-like domain
VKVDAGNFADLFLIKHCTRGAASAEQDGDTAEWRQGQTMILSAGRETGLQFDHAFQQRSVRLDTIKLEATCARWLGHPLEQSLQFTLRSFSDEMERIWQQTLMYAGTSEAGGVPLIGPAKESNLRLESFRARRCAGDANRRGKSSCLAKSEFGTTGE